MAKKGGSEFVCQNCGSVYPKWQGKCDACGEWNTIVEEKVGGEGFSNLTPKKKGRILEFVPLSGAETALSRIPTGIKELDRVSGGGLVPGSAILVGGDPGIGKSTLLLQVCASIANAPSKPECYYISGEEAIDQVRIRAKRLGLEQSPVNLASTTDVKDIIETLDKSDAAVVIIDSIQTMYLEEVESTPGSVAQVRACAYELIKLAKKKGFVLFSSRSCNQTGSHCRPARFWNIWSTPSYISKANAATISAFCVRSKTVTVPQTKSAFLKCRTRGLSKSKIRRRCFWPKGREIFPVLAFLPELKVRGRYWLKFRLWSVRPVMPVRNGRLSAGIPTVWPWFWPFWKHAAA